MYEKICQRLLDSNIEHLTAKEIYKIPEYFDIIYYKMTDFKLPVYYDGQEGYGFQLFNEKTVETVCFLSSRKPDTKVRLDVNMEDYYRIKDAK